MMIADINFYISFSLLFAGSVLSGDTSPKDNLPSSTHPTTSLASGHAATSPRILVRSLEEAYKTPEVLELFAKDPEDGVKGSISRLPRVVDPSIFYIWLITCPSGEELVASINFDPANYPQIDGRTRPRYWTYSDPRRRLLDATKRCKNCKCDEDGTIIPDLDRDVAREWLCRTDTIARECRHWHRCQCLLFMRQPDVEPGNSITDYQNALNNLPYNIKTAAPGYEWKISDRFSMTWQYTGNPQSGGQYNVPNDRVLVPGTKEPYYLEGPSHGSIRGWQSHSMLRMPLSQESGFLRVKRDPGYAGGSSEIGKTGSHD
ncbi:hypothetical protein TWF281_008923 [Arthrobotrys megalospora]